MFGVSKQAYYSHTDNFFERLCQEQFVVDYIVGVRSKASKMGLCSIWYKYKKDFGESAIGRDAFIRIGDSYDLKLHKAKPRVKTTDSCHNLPKYPDIVKDLLITRKNEVWVSDITYIQIFGKNDIRYFCYISLIMDAHTREVLGYCVAPTLAAKYTLKALNMALVTLKGLNDVDLIHHSDRGVQYASLDYTAVLRKHGIRISMTECGNPKDNAQAERLNGTIKNQILGNRKFRSISEVKRAIAAAVDFYNNERPHMSLNRLTPIEAAALNTIPRKLWTSYREKHLKGAL